MTAQKRAQNLQDVPLAVSAIAGEEMLNMGVFKSTDLASKVPNLQISSFFGESQPNFTIRGIGVANEFSANQASPVGIYVDENYVGARFAHGAQMLDMERIEVLKGPQGTLYGRNTTGGAINFITNKPTLAPVSSGSLKAGLGNFNRREMQGVFDYSLVPDEYGLRAAVSWVRADGAIPNKTLGQPDLASQNDFSSRLSFRAKPVDGVDINWKNYYSKMEDGPYAPYFIGYRDPADPSNPDGHGNANSGGAVRDGLDFYESAIDYTHLYKTETYGSQLNAAIRLGDALDLTSITAYDGGRAFYPQDVDGSATAIMAVDWGSDYDQFNQDLRLSFDGDGPLQLIGGLYFGTDTINIHKNANLFSFGIFSDLHTQQTRDSYAGYAEAAYKINEALTFTLGGRYTRDELKFRSHSWLLSGVHGTPVCNSVPDAGCLSGDPAPFDPTLRRVVEDSTSKVTGRAILDYKFARDKMVYGSFSRGYRAPAINGNIDLSDRGDNDRDLLAVVAPETIDAYEIGFKSRLAHNRVQLNAAAFYYKYDNQQIQRVVQVTSVLESSGPAKAFGGELELNWVATGTLRTNLTLGLLDTEFKNLELNGVDLSGNQFSNAPKVTASGGFDWDFFENAQGIATLHLDATYTSRQYFSPFNNDPSFVGDTIGNGNQSQDGFTLLNARASFRAGEITFGAWGKNLTNREYLVQGLDLRSGFGEDALVRGMPRTFGADVSFSF
ncbi:TonB-dependent receptor [Solimonas soli]|uniref:TonB-dependent receptor n=1 Tax=Solimonas soli TaxID=413479 RepID=UPI0004809FA4|nr:TonB-dependent receptor [Solimonas soli]